ncbi:Crp/Fnr family transcriptional regulator [Sulfitobacter sp. S0837]|uniref:Crp/Fnr family transcriptional regulator n=1 Tax=Sulfitobacter maritimus TaxID=2741719 RepID=UPI0015832478|nr:Crp/Fnr family transcriptional regulator [Sulfitobacter maritimus]NUH67012.1 Crp/Fnr family transcriptional regulator [Sulfitobacter maritimus]
MPTQCRYCPLQRKEAFLPMTKEELMFMEKFKSGELTVEPGTPILLEGSNAPQLYTALSGMGIRDKTLENGKRQVINFVFPGDFIGLQAGVMGEMGHSVEARTHMRLCVFNRSEFYSFFKSHPERAFDITWLAAIEEHFMGEVLATIGQRTASQAIAWALLKIFERGQSLGMVTHNQMPLPYTQRDLADALGLSLVHTNKKIAALRERQLLSWADGVLQINSVEALAKEALTTPGQRQKRPLM